MGRGFEQTFLERRHTGGQQAREKMVRITNHQGNASQNHKEKRESYTIGGIVSQCSHYGEQYGGSSKKLRIELPYDPVIPPLGMYLKKIKTVIQKDICLPMYVHCNITSNGQDMKATWMFIGS